MATAVTHSEPHSKGQTPDAQRPGKMTSVAEFVLRWANVLGTLLPVVLGISVLVVFGFFVVFLLRNTTANETVWSRFIFVFGAVQTIALAATTFFFGKTVNAEQQKASDAKKAKAVAVSGLSQVVKELEKKLEGHEGVTDTATFLRSLSDLGKANPQLAVGDDAFADHVRFAFPEDPPSGHRDLWEIATLARSALAQAESI